MTTSTLSFNPRRNDSSMPDAVFNSLSVSLAPLLGGFEGHSLEDQSAAALMNRVDTKYLFSIQMLPDLLRALGEDYSVLDIDGRRIFTYDTTYLDTPGRHFYHSHHNGKLNRNKVRFRHYVDTNTAFLEIKFKNNKERTIKTRTLIDLEQPDFDSIQDFINNKVPVAVNQLEKSLFVRYRRITLMNPSRTERLTLDLDLCFESVSEHSKIRLSPVWLAELKRDNKVKQSSFSRFVRQHQVPAVSFSKYCIGSTLTDSAQLKSNRFKPPLRHLNRYLNRENSNDCFFRH